MTWRDELQPPRPDGSAWAPGRMWAMPSRRRRGRLPSRGETGKPRRLPRIQPPVKPPKSLTLDIPDDVDLFYETSRGRDGVMAWLEAATADWRARVLAEDSGASFQTTVADARVSQSGRVTVYWRPGDTEPHQSPTGRPGARVR